MMMASCLYYLSRFLATKSYDHTSLDDVANTTICVVFLAGISIAIFYIEIKQHFNLKKYCVAAYRFQKFQGEC
jgi:hypothetical protein